MLNFRASFRPQLVFPKLRSLRNMDDYGLAKRLPLGLLLAYLPYRLIFHLALLGLRAVPPLDRP